MDRLLTNFTYSEKGFSIYICAHKHKNITIPLLALYVTNIYILLKTYMTEKRFQKKLIENIFSEKMIGITPRTGYWKEMINYRKLVEREKNRKRKKK